MKLFALASAAGLFFTACIPAVGSAREIGADVCLAPWAASYTGDHVQRIDVRNSTIVGRTCPIPQTGVAPTTNVELPMQDVTPPVKRLTREEIRAELNSIRQAPSDSQRLALGSNSDPSSPN